MHLMRNYKEKGDHGVVEQMIFDWKLFNQYDEAESPLKWYQDAPIFLERIPVI